MKGRLLGPKCSTFLLILSVWGVLMLLMMGIFARVNAVSFAEDLPLDEEAWKKTGYSPPYLDDAYVLLSNNCFIAAGIYVFIGGFAGIQFYINQRSSIMI